MARNAVQSLAADQPDALEANVGSSMSTQVVLLRVGIDSGSGGIQGPLFADGTFEFMCIPDGKGVSIHTYGNMVGKNGRPHVGYFTESRRTAMADQTVHVDPEWTTFTYGDPTPPKRSLRHLRPGNLLVFYCGLQEWSAERGWNGGCRPALYLAGYFQVALAGMAGSFDKKVLKSEFGQNFHVRYPSVFQQQKDDLVLVKGGSGSRLFRKARQISVEGEDRAGKPLKVLSPAMQKVFGTFGGRVSIQRSPPRWVEPRFVDRAIAYLEDLE
jgi:Nucleotide modification associated domain 3